MRAGILIATTLVAGLTCAAEVRAQSQPLAVSRGDFDRNGISDVVMGYRAGDTGRLTVDGGTNVEVPEPPDFIGVGDFDGDGYLDIATAAAHSQAVYLLAGDGGGHFSPSRRIELPGRVTAFIAREINRADGLQDLIVALQSEDRAMVAVFEGRDGALRAEPELLTLPDEAVGLETENIDQDFLLDLVVTTAHDVLIVKGRDQRLRPHEMPEMRSVSLLPALRSPLRIAPDAAQTFEVTSIQDSGPGTLRQAILDANANPGMDTITFNLPNQGPNYIQVNSPLPTIISPVMIDGTSQPGFAGTPIVGIGGAFAGIADGLTITAGDSTLQGLIIHDFNGNGIVLTGNGFNTIRGCFIGTNGTNNWSNTKNGIVIESHENTIGGTTPADRNVISANVESGVLIDGLGAFENDVQGNFIGTDNTGTNALGNHRGVTLHMSASNRIGGPGGGEGNVISGNIASGVEFEDSPPFAQLNLVQGNLIGTDATGTSKVGNGGEGVRVGTVTSNTIGGPTLATRNIISGNHDGVYLAQTAAQFVEHNHIGIDANGLPLGNTRDGVVVFQSSFNTIEKNVISGNGEKGVRIDDTGADDNTLVFNFIGTDPTGTLDAGNGEDGVYIRGGKRNTVGGMAFQRNLISGNDHNGISIYQGEQNNIESNRIGTNGGATSKLPNDRAGVRIEQGSDNTLFSNVISGNGVDGVLLLASNQTIAQNWIGTAFGNFPGLGNPQGIEVFGDENSILANTVSGNLTGIFVGTGKKNVIQANKIGTDTLGTAVLSNGVGVLIRAATETLVQSNVISGNTDIDVKIESGPNKLYTNLIGTDATGTVVLSASKGQHTGVLITASQNEIGGTWPTGGNVIAGHFRGVWIKGEGATANLVQNNSIGTDKNNTLALANYVGVLIEDAPQNFVGGQLGDANIGNVISGNEWGVWIHGPAATGNKVRWNHVGVGVGNTSDGVLINSAPGNLVESNVISGNFGNGVRIEAGTAILNEIKANSIGVDGTTKGGNGGSGVMISGGASQNTLDDNEIAFNGRAGISVVGASSTRNGIFSGNSIHSNALLGIDLSDDGVTPNDGTDPDPGPNLWQNYPVLSGAGSDAVSTTVTGTFQSTPKSVFTINFFSSPACDASGFGEGRSFVGQILVMTNGLGLATFSNTLNVPTPQGHVITATARDTQTNTSEFSKCVVVGARRQ